MFNPLTPAARWFSRRSLRTQIVSLMLASVVIGTGMLGYLSYNARMRQAEAEIIEQARALTGMTARATASSMLERDYSSLELFLDELMSLPDVQVAELVHPGGKVAMRASQSASGSIIRLPTNESAEPPALSHTVQDMRIHSAATLMSGSAQESKHLDRDALLKNGWVRLEVDQRRHRSEALQQWLIDGLNGSILLIGMLWLLAIFLGRVFRPISELAAFTSQLAVQPGATVKIRWGSREVRELGRTLNAASERLNQQIRSQELRFNQLRAVLDTAADAIVGVSSEGDIASTNPAAERMFGLDAAALHTRSIAEFLPGLDAARLKTIMEEGMLFHSTQSRVGRVEIEARRQDGTVFPVELLLGEIAGDQALRYTCIVRDLTDMKLAEEYLTLYGRVLDCIPNGISVSNARRYPQPIVHVNPAFCRITGYAPREVLGRDASFLEGEKTDAEDLALLARTVQNGNEIKLTLQNYRKDGSLFHNKLSVSPVRDARGEITHYINVIEDVSGQVEVKQRLIERTARLNATFDLSPDGFAVFDAQGELITSNPALRHMLGKVPAWIPLERFDDWVRELCEEPERYHPVAQAPNDGAKHTLVLARPTHAVLERDIRRHLSGSGETFVYFRDVTHQFEVDRMKSEFLATAAHELRTPLASILGFTELMIHRQVQRRTSRKDLLQTVHRQGTLLSNLIQELLDLSRIEARQGKDFHILPTPLTAIVRRGGATAPEPPGTWPAGDAWSDMPVSQVMADASKIQQALTNLLSNAFKYSPVVARYVLADGVRRLSATVKTMSPWCSVHDQGIGMTPEPSCPVPSSASTAPTVQATSRAPAWA